MVCFYHRPEKAIAQSAHRVLHGDHCQWSVSLARLCSVLWIGLTSSGASYACWSQDVFSKLGIRRSGALIISSLSTPWKSTSQIQRLPALCLFVRLQWLQFLQREAHVFPISPHLFVGTLKSCCDALVQWGQGIYFLKISKYWTNTAESFHSTYLSVFVCPMNECSCL